MFAGTVSAGGLEEFCELVHNAVVRLQLKTLFIGLWPLSCGY